MNERTIVWVSDDEPDARVDWERCEEGDVRIKAFESAKELVRGLDWGRPDIVVMDVVEGDDRVAGLIQVSRALEHQVPAVVLYTGHAEDARSQFGASQNVVVVDKRNEGDDPWTTVETALKDDPLKYLAFRLVQQAREKTAEFMGKAGAPGSGAVASLATRMTAGDAGEDQAIKVFARNVFRAFIQEDSTSEAGPEDIYQLYPAGRLNNYGNILVCSETGTRLIVLSPVCDLHGADSKRPSDLLTFRCWSSTELARHVRTRTSPNSEQSGRIHGHWRVRDLKDPANAIGEMCKDEWCYVLPSPDAEDAWVVDFTMPSSMEASQLTEANYRIEATVEREWVLHMTHHYSRYVGRIGVQDVARDGPKKHLNAAFAATDAAGQA